jgi:hypothetical protein
MISEISIRLNDDLLDQARTIAYDQQTTLTELIAAGLRMELERRLKRGFFITTQPNAIVTISAQGADGEADGRVDIHITTPNSPPRLAMGAGRAVAASSPPDSEGISPNDPRLARAGGSGGGMPHKIIVLHPDEPHHT